MLQPMESGAGGGNNSISRWEVQSGENRVPSRWKPVNRK
jgi:hypothetical protein